MANRLKWFEMVEVDEMVQLVEMGELAKMV